jgi:hypothetical protein
MEDYSNNMVSQYCISRYTVEPGDAIISNPYLMEVLEKLSVPSNSDPLKTANALTRYRQDFVTRYAFSIPTIDIISIIAAYSPIVEIGAGSGYWAMCLTQLGVDIIAYDKNPPEERIPWWEPANSWFDTEWYAVYEGDESIGAAHADRSLFLCWPEYGSPMAFNALNAYAAAGGRIVIYIGDRKSSADEKFFHLMDGYELLSRRKLWGWFGIDDQLEIRRINRS